MQHVDLLTNISGKSLIWLRGWNALNLPVLPVSGFCLAVHGSQRFSRTCRAQTVGLYSQFPLKNKQASVVLTQVGHLLYPVLKYWFMVVVHCFGFQKWIISNTVLQRFSSRSQTSNEKTAVTEDLIYTLQWLCDSPFCEKESLPLETTF